MEYLVEDGPTLRGGSPGKAMIDLGYDDQSRCDTLGMQRVLEHLALHCRALVAAGRRQVWPARGWAAWAAVEQVF